jgi:hypothetical protein
VRSPSSAGSADLPISRPVVLYRAPGERRPLAAGNRYAPRAAYPAFGGALTSAPGLAFWGGVIVRYGAVSRHRAGGDGCEEERHISSRVSEIRNPRRSGRNQTQRALHRSITRASLSTTAPSRCWSRSASVRGPGNVGCTGRASDGVARTDRFDVAPSLPVDFPEDIAVQRRAPYESHADSIMYRQVLAELAHARGWEVHLYNARCVEDEAASILAERTHDVLHGPRATLGPPWSKDHRMALAATIVNP